MSKPKKDGQIFEKDIPPASFDEMSPDEMRVLLREYQIKIEEQNRELQHRQQAENNTILNKILMASTELIDENPAGINYQKMTDTVREISGAQYACFNIFDENGLDFTTIALSGINENIKKAAAILGFEIKNKKWKQDPDRIKKIGQNAITKFSVLNELTGSVIPDSIVKIIINTFNLGEIFLVKIDKNNKPIGEIGRAHV